MQAMTFHDQAYEFYPWESLGKDIFDLSKKIIDSGEKYDRIIALAKGGLTFSRSLVDYLNVQEVSSIQIQFYTGIGTTNRTPIITQSLPVSIKDENILIFDDIVDNMYLILFLILPVCSLLKSNDLPEILLKIF